MKLQTICKHLIMQLFTPGKLLRHKYEIFKDLLRHDEQCLVTLTELEEIQQQHLPVDWARINFLVHRLVRQTAALIQTLLAMRPLTYGSLEKHFDVVQASMEAALACPIDPAGPPFTVDLAQAAASPLLAGGKAHALGRVQVEAGLPTPPGFVITTNSFQLFLEHNRLRPELNRLLAEVNLNDWEKLAALTDTMTGLVLQGQVPPEVSEAIGQRLEELTRRGVTGPWSVRSSARSEDGELSFAGQYASVLEVNRDGLLSAYKEVLASKYSARAVTYRHHSGLADAETPMAVLILPMIDAQISGVVYTRAVAGEAQEESPVAVFAICGQGQHLVDGSLEPETFFFSRDSQPQLLATAGQQFSCLTPAAASRLAAWGLCLENLLGGPQDIEWCQDGTGECYILQSRPLKTVAPVEEKALPAADWDQEKIPVLLEGGVTASAGVGWGVSHLVRHETELGGVPQGAVLIAPTLSPTYAGIINRLRAVVADGGSQASHFASIAREFGLPVLAGTREATKRLPAGQPLIVDADQHRVYLAEAADLPAAPVKSRPAAAAPFFQRLHSVMELISPLHLLDPGFPEFAPDHCRSLHDFIRFAHEKGMAAMFSLVGPSGRGLGRARQLATDLPFTLYVLDLNDTISPAAAGMKAIAPELIASRPMQACWQGLTHPEVVWHRGLVYMDWEAVDRMSGGIMSLKSAALASYALVARDYLHLVLRFGYHFALLDTLCGDNPEANYISYRFKGGGGSYEGRIRRVRFIEKILVWAGFKVATREDLLEARFERREAEVILTRLTLWGIVQGKTQLLDMSLTDDDQVEVLVEGFQAKFSRFVED